MSLEPPSSSGLPGRSRPVLSDLSRETTEGDLWNLDDELTETTISTVDYPPQPRMGLEPIRRKDGKDGKDGKDAEDAEDGEEAPATKLRNRTPDPVRHESEEPAARKLGRTSPLDEIGDLEEAEPDTGKNHDEAAGDLRSAPVAQAPIAAPRSVQADPDLDKPPPDDSQTALPPGETGPAKPNQRRGQAPATRPAAAAAATSSLPQPRLTRPGLNRREVIGLAAFSFTLLLAVIWMLTRFFSAFEFKSEFVKGPDFPVKGERVQLEQADTFWREPVRTGETRDFARREVTMIPVLELTLDPDETTGGALLVIFRNSENEPVGDSIRRSFTGAHFDANSLATIAFPSTDGFVAEGDFNAYRAGKGESWMAEVFEGPSIDAAADQFKLIASIPVLPKLR